MTIASNDLAVRPATDADADRLIAVLAEAFHDGPVADWLIPDPDERRAVYYRYFPDALQHGLEHGKVYTTSDQSAVTIWYPRLEPTPTKPHQRLEDAGDHRRRPRAEVRAARRDVRRLPPRRSHTTTSPTSRSTHTRQNRGIGTALLNRPPPSPRPARPAGVPGSHQHA